MRKLIKNPETLSFADFIRLLDEENTIVVLAGKRDVLESDKPKLLQLGELLAQKTKNIIFRSGNADGSDKLFSDGVIKINSNRLQAIAPYLSHNNSNHLTHEIIHLDSLDLTKETDLIYTAKKNKNVKGLVEEYLKGVDKRLKSKGAYLLRDTLMVTGTKTGILPANFAIFYDDLRKPEQGGTGHTMLMCKEKNVPFIDQRTWMKWL
jgi:hypothetical protein